MYWPSSSAAANRVLNSEFRNMKKNRKVPNLIIAIFAVAALIWSAIVRILPLLIAAALPLFVPLFVSYTVYYIVNLPLDEETVALITFWSALDVVLIEVALFEFWNDIVEAYRRKLNSVEEYFRQRGGDL